MKPAVRSALHPLDSSEWFGAGGGFKRLGGVHLVFTFGQAPFTDPSLVLASPPAVEESDRCEFPTRPEKHRRSPGGALC